MICTATRQDGQPCRAHAVRGTSPPRCSAHRTQSQIGAPPGNQNARTHGAYSHVQPDAAAPATQRIDLDAAILDLQRRLDQLSDYIDQGLNDAKLDIGDYARLTGLQGQLASRLGRLIRDRQSIAGDTDNQTLDALNAALDSISEEWGIEL